jgi:phage gpG-like protein
MAKQNKFNFKGIEKKAKATLGSAMVEIGNAAKSFFVENFRKQGFDDKSVEKWPKRKKTERKGRGKYAKGEDGKRDKNSVRSVKAGRAILVKTGDLRRSIIRNPANRAALSVKISTDLPYAKVHNNGETINVDGRKGSGTITRSIRGSAGFKDGKFTRGRAKKVTFQGKEYTTGSYAIKMPKRQFMGDSYNLNERIKKIIVKRLDKTFK